MFQLGSDPAVEDFKQQTPLNHMIINMPQLVRLAGTAAVT